MKRAQVKRGVEATLRVGRKRIAVWVSYRLTVPGERLGKPHAETWAVVDNDGRYHVCTPAQLRPA